MRTTLFTLAAAAAIALASAGSVRADTPVRSAPVAGGHLTLPPGTHPGWPGYPWPRPPYYPPPQYPPYYPPPRPRPPAVQIQYTVHYRPGPYSPWRVYGRYASHARAQRAADRLERQGYRTDIVVTYGR